MAKDLNTALNNVEMTYSQIIEIANDMLKPILDPVNNLVNSIDKRGAGMPVDSLRETMLQIQMKAFEICEVKEKSALKAECAEAIKKEKFATSFNGATGTAGVKENTALLESSEETVVECLYNLVANLLKAKVDQLHKIVEVLKSILMSRMQEAKFMNIGATNDIPATTGKSYSID